jgi:hypothetical protein
MEEEVTYQNVFVHGGEKFDCPFCKTEYVLDLEGLPVIPVARPLNGVPCEHLDPKILISGDGRWRARFATPVEENAPLRQKVAYLLNSAGPFHAWLARKKAWEVVGKTEPGDENPISQFLAESLRLSPDMVWVDRDASTFVRTESGEIIFFPNTGKVWLLLFVWRIWERSRGYLWTAGEAIELIESINRSVW